MRVALFTETFLPATDGVVTRMRHTIEELARAGDEMLVIAPKYPDGGPNSYAGVPIYRVPGVSFPLYPRITLSPSHWGVGRALKRFRPDVIHAVNPFILGVGGMYYAWRFGLPLVASYHTKVAAYARYYKMNHLADLARWYTRQMHNRADINLCTSEATRDYLVSEGVRNVRLWPQGVDSRRFRPDLASPEWRGRLSDGNPDDRVLLYVGRLAPEKGIETLEAVLRKMPGTRLAIVGDGPARGALERVYAGTPTVFTGLLQGEDLAAAYASADVFVFPSTTDTLGMAMLEALSSGLPVLASRSGGSHEIVSEGENGLLYEAGSAASLVAAARELLENGQRLGAMGLRARAVAETRDWETSTRTLRGYYEQAVGAP